MPAGAREHVQYNIRVERQKATTKRGVSVNPLEQLVFSYIRVMQEWERTGDPGYRKTSGMLRERLRRQGIAVLDWIQEPAGVTVRVKAGDEVTLLHLPPI